MYNQRKIIELTLGRERGKLNDTGLTHVRTVKKTHLIECDFSIHSVRYKLYKYFIDEYL